MGGSVYDERPWLARYAERGLLVPTLVLPSGHLRWNLEDVRRQLREIRIRREQGNDA